MSEGQLYDLVVTGHSSQVKVADLVKDLMVILQKKNPRLEYKLTEALIFEANANSALEGVSLAVAEEYQRKFAALNVISEIRPTIDILPTEDPSAADSAKDKIYVCPACRHEQPKVTNRLDMCDQCGVIGEKYANTSRLKIIMEEEKLRIAQEQALTVRESLAKADLEEKYRLRKEARRRLGIQSSRTTWLKFAATGTGVAALCVGTFYGADAVHQYYQKSSEQTELIQQTTSDTDLGFDAIADLDANSDTSLDQEMSEQMIATAMQVDQGEGQKVNAEVSGGITLDAERMIANGDMSKTGVTTISMGGGLLAAQKPKVTHGGRGMEILYTLERSQLAYPRFQRETGQFMADHLYVANLLKQQRPELVDIFIETLTNPYEQALLYMERDGDKKIPSKDLLKKLQGLYNAAESIEDKSLLMGAASSLVKKVGNAEGATKLLNNGIKLVSSIEALPERLQLLSRLANEQYLFDEHDVAATILALIERQLKTVVPEQKETLVAKMAASYFIMGDQANALRLSEYIANPKVRQTLFQTMQEQQMIVSQTAK